MQKQQDMLFFLLTQKQFFSQISALQNNRENYLIKFYGYDSSIDSNQQMLPKQQQRQTSKNCQTEPNFSLQSSCGLDKESASRNYSPDFYAQFFLQSHQNLSTTLQQKQSTNKSVTFSNKKIIKKRKRDCSQRKKPKKLDYKKNICGYITKSVFKAIKSQEYDEVILFLCCYLGTTVQAFKQFYQIRSKTYQITGPTHLYNLLTSYFNAQMDQAEMIEDFSIRKVFRVFFIWFLRNRYLRHMMKEGKMDRKEEYIKYKNLQLSLLLYENEEDDAQEIQILKKGMKIVGLEKLIEKCSKIKNHLQNKFCSFKISVEKTVMENNFSSNKQNTSSKDTIERHDGMTAEKNELVFEEFRTD